MPRVFYAALMVMLVAGGVLIARGGDDRAQARPGEIVDYAFHVTDGTKSSIRLPVGTIAMVSTPVLDDLDDVDGMPSDAPAAPDGGGFIGFDLYLRTSPSILALTQPAGDALEATFTLAVGKDRYPLESPYELLRSSASSDAPVPARTAPSTGRSTFIAVAGEPDRIVLEVTYDGVMQSVDLLTGDRTPGLAAGMYEPSADAGPVPQAPCGELEPSLDVPRVQFAQATCAVTSAALLPYTSELGWAPPGRRWAIASVQTRLTGPLRWTFSSAWTQDQRLTTYRKTRFTADVTLDGRAPLSTAPLDPLNRPADDVLQWQDRTYTWEVDPAAPMKLHVGDAFSSELATDPDPEAPKSVRLAFDQTVQLKF